MFDMNYLVNVRHQILDSYSYVQFVTRIQIHCLCLTWIVSSTWDIKCWTHIQIYRSRLIFVYTDCVWHESFSQHETSNVGLIFIYTLRDSYSYALFLLRHQILGSYSYLQFVTRIQIHCLCLTWIVSSTWDIKCWTHIHTYNSWLTCIYTCTHAFVLLFCKFTHGLTHELTLDIATSKEPWLLNESCSPLGMH